MEVSNFTPANVYQGTHVSNGTRHTACIGKATRGPTTLGLAMNVPKTNQLHPRKWTRNPKREPFWKEVSSSNFQLSIFGKMLVSFQGGNGTLVVWDSRGGAPKIPFTKGYPLYPNHRGPKPPIYHYLNKKHYHKNQMEVEYNEYLSVLTLNSSFC